MEEAAGFFKKSIVIGGLEGNHISTHHDACHRYFRASSPISS